MKDMINKEALDWNWEFCHQRVSTLTELMNQFPVLAKVIYELKTLYIKYMNSITLRDYNQEESLKKLISRAEEDFNEQAMKLVEDRRRSNMCKKSTKPVGIMILEVRQDER
jgi:hypothetical protein